MSKLYSTAGLNMPVSLHIADHPSCSKPLGPTQEHSPAFDALSLHGQGRPGPLMALWHGLKQILPSTEQD